MTLDERSELTTKLANALARIDPNTKNGDEGKAFIKKMYKMRGKMPSIRYTKAAMPDTPELCVDIVAGKVIQIENLQEEFGKKKKPPGFRRDSGWLAGTFRDWPQDNAISPAKKATCMARLLITPQVRYRCSALDA